MGWFFGRQGTTEEDAIRKYKDDGSANFLSGIGQALGLDMDFGAALTSYLKAMTGEDLTNAQRKTMDFNALEAQKQRDWEADMANTTYQRGVADMQAAGLNPALAYSQGGAPTPQGSSAGASSPTAAGLGDIFTLITGMKRLDIEGKVADSEIALNKANAGKVESETAYQDIINMYEQASRELDIELKRSELGLTEEQIKQVAAMKEKIEKERDLIIEQITTEMKKQDLIVSEEALNKALSALHNMQTKEIKTLLPLKESLLQSEVKVNEVQAGELYAKQLQLTQEYWFKMKLYENPDYVDAVADLMISEAEKEGNEAAVSEMRKRREEVLQKIRDGKAFSFGNETIDKYFPLAINGILQAALYAIEVAGPALLGFAGGSAVKGYQSAKNAKKVAEQSKNIGYGGYQYTVQ